MGPSFDAEMVYLCGLVAVVNGSCLFCLEKICGNYPTQRAQKIDLKKSRIGGEMCHQFSTIREFSAIFTDRTQA